MKAQYDIAPRWRDVAPHSAIAPHLFAGANGVPNGSGISLHFVASTDMWAGAAEKIEKVMQNDAF